MSLATDTIRKLLDLGKRDLTRGSISTGLLALAAPIVLANIFHSIQSLVDMFFVGKLGAPAVAALGMSGTVMMMLITIFVGLNFATIAMISRAYGAGNYEKASHVAGQCLLITIVGSVLIGIIGYAAAPAMLRVLGAQPEVMELGTGYLRIVLPGIFFLSAMFIITGIFHGTGDAVTPLLLGILTTILNVILNPILIFGHFGFPAMGVRGSAAATIAARVLSFGIGLVVLYRGRVHVRLHNMVPDRHTMWSFFTIGLPGTLQMGLRMAMNVILVTIVATFGTSVVAAYTVGWRIRMLGLFPSFAFGAAAASMVGQNLGTKRPDRSEKSAIVAAGMAFLAALLIALVSFVIAPQIVSIFSNDISVIQSGTFFLRVTAGGLAAASVSIVLGRAMGGAGDTVSPMVITFISLWGFQIPAAIYMSGAKEIWGISMPYNEKFLDLGADGIWYAILAASILQAAITVFWFSRGRWKTKEI